MSDALPGRLIDLPVPQELAEALGYRGSARYVGFRYIHDADDLVMDDGKSGGNAATQVFHLYHRHRVVAPLLDGAGIGLREYPPTHWLVLDREDGRASLVPAQQARQFLFEQWPPLTQEQIDALRAQWEAMPDQGWREERVDSTLFRQAIEEQRGRVGRLLAWLDQCPTPPQRGRGA
jgi:hypothetical protein